MYIRWAGSTTIWDFAAKSFSLKLWYSYARKEGKWWKVDKLHSRHFELPGEWAPTCLSSNSAIRWEERFIFISPALLSFLVWHEVCYSPSLFAKISRRCIHPGKYIFRVTKIRSNNKNLYSNHIVPNWKRNPLGGTLGICVSLTSRQLHKWQRMLAQLPETFGRCFWLCVAGRWPNVQRPWQRSWHQLVVGPSLFSLPLTIDNPEDLTSPCFLDLWACNEISLNNCLLSCCTLLD